jgi:prepilin-type N-terminal cleavage/methylation domain-containing protein
MRGRSEGLALLELLVAMTILGIGFSLVFAGMSESTRNIGRLESVQDRQLLTRNLLGKLQLVRDLRPGDTARGTFEDGTRWRVEVRPLTLLSTDAGEPDGIVRIDIHFEWDGKSGVLSRTIETYRFVRNPAAAIRRLEDQLRALDQ